MAGDGSQQKVNRAAPNAPSVIYDGVIVLGGESAAMLAKSGLAIHFVNEAFRHGKPIAAFGDGAQLLKSAHLHRAGEANGVVVTDGSEGIGAFIEALKQHRFPRRKIDAVPA